MTFDPNSTGNKNNGIFSLPMNEEESQLVFLPIPWEVTTSYGDGCSLGPMAILEASKQLDLFDALYGEFYKKGMFAKEFDHDFFKRAYHLKQKALAIRDQLQSGLELTHSQKEDQAEINFESEKMNEWVYRQAQKILEQNKFCAAIGGDHSAPLGLMKALKEKYSDLSILHIDAHMDLRVAYQGYKYSHASIMYNAINELNINSLVQVGIRDFCPQEQDISQSNDHIFCFYDSQITVKLAEKQSWSEIVDQIIQPLSKHVYISFDIDGLSPDLCPTTGTPVPGGLSFSQAEYLLYKLSKTSKKIVGFDLCEVSPGNLSLETSLDSKKLEGWDANVGARILFKLSGALLTNQNQ